MKELFPVYENNKDLVYLDNAATTQMRKEVLDEMLPYFIENYGNASSIYSIGRKNKAVLDEKRAQIANILGAKDREIFFTSGGSEADNWAIKGVMFANRAKGNHIITTKIELQEDGIVHIVFNGPVLESQKVNFQREETKIAIKSAVQKALGKEVSVKYDNLK